jgi:rhodanese-related sulfurtransferase
MKLSKSARVMLWSAVGVSAAVFGLWWLADHRRGLAWAMAVIKDRFPDVPQLPSGRLAEWLAAPQRHPHFLLDARSAEEFAVSHVPTAERIDPDTPDADLLAQVPKGLPLVVYCAAGYRGSQMARRLRGLGYPDVSNLSGGIFQWVNEGREVHRDGHAVREVHSFSGAFRRLLHPDARR